MIPKRALVIEGGGFRAAYAAGAVYQLLRQAPDLHFDVVAANSSSVCTAAYFVTQQIKEMEAIWFETDCLASPELLSWKRAPISFYRSFLNIDYLFDDIFAKRYPLDLKALAQAKTNFFVTVMQYPSGKCCQFSNRDPEIYEAMRASCAVPWAYIGKVMIQGERYMDGYYDSIPLRIALEQTCDEIWIISTRPKGYRKKRLSLLEKIPLRHFQLMSKRYLYYNETAEEVEKNPRYIIVRPGQMLQVKRLTNDLNLFREALRLGREDMKELLWTRDKGPGTMDQQQKRKR